MPSGLNLVRAFQSTVRHNGLRPALLDGERSITWAEFSARVARLAGALHAGGLRAGDRLGLLSRNGFRLEELKWAALWCGAVPVAINWRLAPPEIAHILRDADCKRLWVENPFADVLAHPALTGAAGCATVFGDATGEAAPLYEQWIAAAPPLPPADPDPDADAMLFYTGGTTGRSKGVRLTHTNIISNATAFALGVGARRHDVYLHAAPMFHSADLIALGWMLQGAAQCYLPAFSPAAFLQAIATYRVSAVVTVPTMLIATVSSPQFPDADLASLRILIYGAAPMAAEWILLVAAAFPPVDFFNCYGLTETAPDLTIFDARDFRTAIDEARRSDARSGRFKSVGKPNLLNEVCAMAPDGSLLPTGAVGEIVARGANLTPGYLNLPEESARAWEGGWFHTGDVGYVDEAGYIYLLDRLKDVVLTGGETVYSSEVEAALLTYPAVAEAAVIGVPDERLGECVMAVVVSRTSQIPDQEELTRICREQLGGFKVPRRYAFVDALPKNAMGKVLKAALRQRFGLPDQPAAVEELRSQPQPGPPQMRVSA